MNSEDKSKLLGLLFWLFTALNVLVVGIVSILILVYFGVIAALLSQEPHRASDPPPELIMGIGVAVFVVVMAIGIFLTLLFAVPKVVAGYGLRNRKPWARTWAIIASIMCCLSFPIGTAVGVFGLVFIFSDEGKKYFADNLYGRLGSATPASPPPPSSWQ